jgi:hypothetical protein
MTACEPEHTITGVIAFPRFSNSGLEDQVVIVELCRDP